MKTLSTWLLFALLIWPGALWAADGIAPAPPLAQQMRNPILEQLQRQKSEADTRAAEAERRERDAELKRLENEAAEARTRADQAERRASDEELKQFVLQEISERENKAYARLETIVSVSIGFFGTLITAVIVFFALRTERAAIAAAKKGVEDELEELRKQAKSGVEEIKGHASEAADLVKQAGEIAKNLPPGEASKSEADRMVVADAADVALAKPLRDRTAEEYIVILSKHAGDQNWGAMLKAAKEMQLLFQEEKEHIVFAHYIEAYALGQLGRREEAIAAFDDVIPHLDSKEDTRQQRWVALSLVKKSELLILMERFDDAIIATEEVIKRYGDSTDPELREMVDLARQIKANIHGHQKK